MSFLFGKLLPGMGRHASKISRLGSFACVFAKGAGDTGRSTGTPGYTLTRIYYVFDSCLRNSHKGFRHYLPKYLVERQILTDSLQKVGITRPSTRANPSPCLQRPTPFPPTSPSPKPRPCNASHPWPLSGWAYRTSTWTPMATTRPRSRWTIWTA